MTTDPVAPAPASPRRWRPVVLASALLSTLVTVLAMSLPWFVRTGGADDTTYTPWLWGDPDAASAPDYPSTTANLIALGVSREWGLSLVIAAAVGAVIGFILTAKRPTDARVNRALIINVVAAALSIVLVGLAWFAFAADGGDGATTSVDIGVMLALPAQIAWLALAIAAMRIAGRARAARRSVADPLSGVR